MIQQNGDPKRRKWRQRETVHNERGFYVIQLRRTERKGKEGRIQWILACERVDAGYSGEKEDRRSRRMRMAHYALRRALRAHAHEPAHRQQHEMKPVQRGASPAARNWGSTSTTPRCCFAVEGTGEGGKKTAGSSGIESDARRLPFAPAPLGGNRRWCRRGIQRSRWEGGEPAGDDRQRGGCGRLRWCRDEYCVARRLRSTRLGRRRLLRSTLELKCATPRASSRARRGLARFRRMRTPARRTPPAPSRRFEARHLSLSTATSATSDEDGDAKGGGERRGRGRWRAGRDARGELAQGADGGDEREEGRAEPRDWFHDKERKRTTLSTGAATHKARRSSVIQHQQVLQMVPARESVPHRRRQGDEYGEERL
ncbi:hypothetical protein C8R45DRAFT_1081853 [Mycena sanguinolenta]|nr:hypothetical protein C8R45DRAFT_1081853 [Mycena sanguinolenta]